VSQSVSEKAKLIRGDPPKIDFKKKGEPPKNSFIFRIVKFFPIVKNVTIQIFFILLFVFYRFYRIFGIYFREINPKQHIIPNFNNKGFSMA
jgi:hypothetical protein